MHADSSVPRVKISLFLVLAVSASMLPLKLAAAGCYPWSHDFYSGDAKHARDDFDSAIRLNPNDLNSHFNLGRLYMLLWQHGKAVREFSEAIRLDSGNPWYYTCRALSYAEIKQFDKSLEDRKTALRLDPKKACHHAGMAITYAYMDRPKWALDEAPSFDLPDFCRTV